MNSRIEPTAEAGNRAAHEQMRGDVFEELVRMMSASPITMLIGPRNEATSRLAREAAIACAELGDRPVGGRCGDVVVLFDRWSGDPLLALGDAIAAAVGSATGIPISHPRSLRRTLTDLLAHWAERFGARFIIVLDQYERNLVAEPLNAHNARFGEQLAKAIAEAAPHTRFLVVVSAESEAALVRLTARLTSPCRSVIRLAGAPAETQQSPARAAPASHEALPTGFSALADEPVDLSVTQAVLRRREKRKSMARWRNAGLAAVLLIVLAAVVATYQRMQVPDPGARLARALDPQQLPAIPVEVPASGPSPVVEPSTGSMPIAATAPGAGDASPAEPSPAALPGPPEPTAPQVAPSQSTGLPAQDVTAQPAAPAAPSPPAVKAEPRLAPSPAIETPPPEPPKSDPVSLAFRIDAPPAPPVPARVARSVANPEDEPMVFIHIRSESQRAQARDLASGLARLNIVVTGTAVEERGPLRGNLRYYRSGERDEANYLGRALARMGAPQLRITQVAGYERVAVPRHFELWLPPPTR
ncbi:MAG: hypothetical protein WCF44_15555 [Candidatus Methylophosphatis roskildensis]